MPRIHERLDPVYSSREQVAADMFGELDSALECAREVLESLDKANHVDLEDVDARMCDALDEIEALKTLIERVREYSRPLRDAYYDRD